MFSVTVKETYQKTIMSPVRLNFDFNKYLRTIEEVSENITSIEQELNGMDVIQTKTRKIGKSIERRIEYHRPGRIGTLVRTIMVTRYNPPKEVSLI